jgi:hypothetical protein
MLWLRLTATSNCFPHPNETSFFLLMVAAVDVTVQLLGQIFADTATQLKYNLTFC